MISVLSFVAMQVSMIEIPCLAEVTIVLLETKDRARRNATSAECCSESPDSELASRSLLRRPHPTGEPRPFHHHYEELSVFVPPTNPAHTPTIDSIAQSRGLEEAKELGFDFHGNTWMALASGTPKLRRPDQIRTVLPPAQGLESRDPWPSAA
jgi:hypothetical protein